VSISVPKLIITNANGKQRSISLVSTSSSQRPNEIQTRELDQVIKRLPAHILEALSARKLTIPPREAGPALSHLKAAADFTLSIGE